MRFAAGPKPDAFKRICPSGPVLARLGEKWALLALVALKDGVVRFGVLQRRLEGVSQKMLTQTLRRLERDGLVLRRSSDGHPIKVEYTLTDRGLGLVPVVLALKGWAENNLHDIAASNATYDARRPVARRRALRSASG